MQVKTLKIRNLSRQPDNVFWDGIFETSSQFPCALFFPSRGAHCFHLYDSLEEHMMGTDYGSSKDMPSELKKKNNQSQVACLNLIFFKFIWATEHQFLILTTGVSHEKKRQICSNKYSVRTEQSAVRLVKRIPLNEFTLTCVESLMKINSVIFYLDTPIPPNGFPHFLSVHLRLVNQEADPNSTKSANFNQ